MNTWSSGSSILAVFNCPLKATTEQEARRIIETLKGEYDQVLQFDITSGDGPRIHSFRELIQNLWEGGIQVERHTIFNLKGTGGIAGLWVTNGWVRWELGYVFQLLWNYTLARNPPQSFAESGGSWSGYPEETPFPRSDSDERQAKSLNELLMEMFGFTLPLNEIDMRTMIRSHYQRDYGHQPGCSG